MFSIDLVPAKAELNFSLDLVLAKAELNFSINLVQAKAGLNNWLADFLNILVVFLLELKLLIRLFS